MNKGSLQQRHGTWYVVVSFKDEFGKPKQKWISTKLRVGNNKTKAKKEMKNILKNLDLNKEIRQDRENSQDLYFVDFLKSYLEIKKQQVEPITYSQYVKESEKISSYFKSMRIKLKDLKPYHIEGFYKSLYEKGLSGNTVLHFHILIRECLQYAFKNDFVNVNVADKVDRPKTDGYKASFYTIDEIQKLFECIKEHECKLPIMLTAMYGFRRSEVLGLKWEAIDFGNKLIYVRHKIIETQIDGKRYIHKADKMKNKTSNRVLPLLPQAEELLLKQKEKVENNKNLLGKSYDKRYLEYVCVDNLGRLILPNRLTHNFIKIIRKNNLKHIRFHDLRHSCASIMLSNGVPMKQIQEWLGHADFGTTANIYSHLDYKTKQNSANTMSDVFGFVKTNQQKEDIEKQNKEYNQQKLLYEIERLKQIIKEKEENEDYIIWKMEREKNSKKKSEAEM